MTIFRHPVQKRRCHLCVFQKVTPLLKAEIGSDYGASGPVAHTHQAKEKTDLGRLNINISQFVDHQ